MKAFLVAVALLALPATAQTAEGVPFAAVYAEAGLPDFPPIERMGLTDPHTARIALPDSSHRLSVVWGARDGAPTFLVLHQTSEGSSFTSFGGRSASAQPVDAVLDLALTPSVSDQTPFEVRVIPDHHLVLYRWPLSAAASAGGVPTAAANPLGIGQQPPDLTLAGLDGGPVRLSDYRGRVVVLNWWSVTCAPCIAELPGLNGLVEQYGDRAAFVAVGWASAADIKAMLGQRAFTYQQTLGDDHATALFGEAFPRHVVLDPEGRVVFDKLGGSEDVAAELAPVIEAALASTASELSPQ